MRRVLAVAAATLLSTTVPAMEPDGPARAIMEADRAFNDAAQEIGVGKAFALFAEDRVQMLNMPQPDMTREQVSALFPSDADLSWTPEDAMVSADGTLGYSWGSSLMRGKAPDGTVVERPGRYLTIWRRQSDGTWKWIADGAIALPPPPKQP